MRQPPMYFPLGGGTLSGVSKPGEIVWSRVFIMDGALHVDLGRGTVVELPPEETRRRLDATTPQWPIMHAVLHGVTPRPDDGPAQGQPRPGRVRRRTPDSADRALLAKAAMFDAMGVAVHLCGEVGHLMGPLLLGIDLGTASSKGVLVDAEGTVRATAVRPRPQSMSMPRPGWAEVDAEQVWWRDVTSIAAELTGKADGAPIAAVCVSGVGPCLVLCDEDDQPVRPAILYGIDMRATAEIEELTGRYGADKVLDRCATPITSQAVGPKALWVRRHEPAVWARARRWYNSSSYVVRRLTGEYVIDHHTASQCVPLYDIEARRWHQPWYDDIMGDLPAPRLAWSMEVAGTVTAAAARETGLAPGTPVCAGTVDAWAEAASVGVRAPAT